MPRKTDSRPPGRDYPVEIKVRMTHQQLAALDDLAGTLKASRAEALRRVLSRWIAFGEDAPTPSQIARRRSWLEQVGVEAAPAKGEKP